MRLIIKTIFIILIFLLINASSFVVQEYEQALIVQLGKALPTPINTAGVHWKIPFIQDVVFFEKRILQWDGQRAEIPTADKKFIWADTTARWRIKNPLTFYKAVRDIPNALSKMGAILNGAVKDTISNHALIETVRNSNAILTDIENNRNRSGTDEETDLESLAELANSIPSIRYGREKLSAMIADRATKDLIDFGIELIDVQLRSIAYKEVVEQKVYNRMISEQIKLADKIRSSGRGEEAKILGQLDLSLKRIYSEAYKESQELKGQAEAEAIDVYADILKVDPEFFEFMKTMEIYKKTFPKKGNFILSTDHALFKLFKQAGN